VYAGSCLVISTPRFTFFGHSNGHLTRPQVQYRNETHTILRPGSTSTKSKPEIISEPLDFRRLFPVQLRAFPHSWIIYLFTGPWSPGPGSNLKDLSAQQVHIDFPQDQSNRNYLCHHLRRYHQSSPLGQIYYATSRVALDERVE